MSDMTPRQAADEAEQVIEAAGLLGPQRRVFQTLIDHARATSPAPEGGDPPSDLLDLVEEFEDDEVENVEWRDRRRYARVLRAHRCAPSPGPSVAAPPREDEAWRAVAVTRDLLLTVGRETRDGDNVDLGREQLAQTFERFAEWLTEVLPTGTVRDPERAT